MKAIGNCQVSHQPICIVPEQRNAMGKIKQITHGHAENTICPTKAQVWLNALRHHILKGTCRWNRRSFLRKAAPADLFVLKMVFIFCSVKWCPRAASMPIAPWATVLKRGTDFWMAKAVLGCTTSACKWECTLLNVLPYTHIYTYVFAVYIKLDLSRR